MEPSEKQLDVLKKMSELEESAGRLYESYAQIFPDYRQFWLGLANEEKLHAEWVKKLHTLIERKTAEFSENRFNSIAIQKFLDYLKEEIGKASRRERALINALSITLYVEESLLENKYFEILNGDSKELKDTLRSLANATQRHIARVREVFNEAKKSTR
jgi:rubrerythrin